MHSTSRHATTAQLELIQQAPKSPPPKDRGHGNPCPLPTGPHYDPPVPGPSSSLVRISYGRGLRACVRSPPHPCQPCDQSRRRFITWALRCVSLRLDEQPVLGVRIRIREVALLCWATGCKVKLDSGCAGKQAIRQAGKRARGWLQETRALEIVTMHATCVLVVAAIVAISGRSRP